MGSLCLMVLVQLVAKAILRASFGLVDTTVVLGSRSLAVSLARFAQPLLRGFALRGVVVVRQAMLLIWNGWAAARTSLPFTSQPGSP